MANFGLLTLTDAGLSVQYKAQDGSPLKFKRIAMGSGNYTGSISSLTKLVTENVSVAITNGYTQNGAYTVEGFFSNDSLQTGFAWREIGLYVEDENGNEVLYCYANAGETYDFIPATADERYTKYIRIATVIGNASNISIVETESLVYVDTQTFAKYKAQIEADKANKDDIIPNNTDTSVCTWGSGAGWYRIAEYKCTSEALAKGSRANSVELIIKRMFGSVTPEYHHIGLKGLYETSSFYNIASESNTHIITKIRHIVDKTNLAAYIDVYYTGVASSNATVFEIDHAKTTDTIYWALPDPYKVDEALTSGQTLYSQMAIPAKCTPATDLDLASYATKENLQDLTDAVIPDNTDFLVANWINAGWHRIAEYRVNKLTAIQGANANSVEILIKIMYGSAQSEVHYIGLKGLYRKSYFYNIMNGCNGHIIKKIRHVVDETNMVAYIDVYYSGTANSNSTAFILNNAKDAVSNWVLITPTIVAEAVADGQTIYSEMDIPANSAPLMDTVTVLSDKAITTVAAELPENSVRHYAFSGTTYTGGDLPETSPANYVYGNATVFKRYGNATIILWGASGCERIAIKIYNASNSTWSEWFIASNQADITEINNKLKNYFSSTESRTKNTVLAAPNGSNGVASFRALVAADLPIVPITKGGTGSSSGATGLKNLFAAGATILSSHQYGDTLPTAGTKGRIFFKKV